MLPDGSYALVPAQHIEEQLHKIVESSPTKAQHPVGVLTSENRDTWHDARERLIAGIIIMVELLAGHLQDNILQTLRTSLM